MCMVSMRSHKTVINFYSTHKYNHMHCCTQGLALQCLSLLLDKRLAFASVHIASNVHLHQEWLHVDYLLRFTADCLLHAVQMAGIETI